MYPEGTEAWKQCQCQNGNCPPDVLYYFHTDHLGSTSFLSDANGTPYQFLLYLPYGELMVEQKAVAQGYETPYRFNGKELDGETGLYNYGARYYDPGLSLWMSVDPLAVEMPKWSPYNFTFNIPLRYVDPLGLAPDDRIINSIDENGNKTKFGRIVTDAFDQEINIDQNVHLHFLFSSHFV